MVDSMRGGFVEGAKESALVKEGNQLRYVLDDKFVEHRTTLGFQRRVGLGKERHNVFNRLLDPIICDVTVIAFEVLESEFVV